MPAEKMIKHEKFYKYYKEWVDTYKVGQVRDVTLKKYYYIAKLLKQYVPDLYLDEMTRGDVQRLVNRYGQTHEKQTVNDFLGHLKAPLRDAVYEGWIYRDPTYKVKATSTFKRLSTRQVCIQPVQVEKLLAVMKERNDVPSLIFDFALRTGLRFAEILGLTPRDVSFDQMVIRVNKSWNYKSSKNGFQPCKNRFSNRTIAIDWKTAADLKKAMIGCPSGDPIFVRALSNEEHLPKSELKKKKIECQRGRSKKKCGNKYSRVYDGFLNRELARDCKKAGVPRITLHSFRHIHGSMLISNHVSIQSVSKRLGHANTITTQKAYIQLLDDLKNQDDTKMIKVLSNLGEPAKVQSIHQQKIGAAV